MARSPFIGSLLFALLAAGLLQGCNNAPSADTTLFQESEELLRRGDYEGATQGYEDFLELYPSSPLAPVARRRLLNIDQQLEAVMGRRPNSPIYIRPALPREEGTDGPNEPDGRWR